MVFHPMMTKGLLSYTLSHNQVTNNKMMNKVFQIWWKDLRTISQKKWMKQFSMSLKKKSHFFSMSSKQIPTSNQKWITRFNFYTLFLTMHRNLIKKLSLAGVSPRLIKCHANYLISKDDVHKRSWHCHIWYYIPHKRTYFLYVLLMIYVKQLYIYIAWGAGLDTILKRL